MNMDEELTKKYADSRLGEKVSVNGEDFVISYEHNVGKLALYSPDGKHYVRLLRKGDVIKFDEGKNERLVLGDIKEEYSKLF